MSGAVRLRADQPRDMAAAEAIVFAALLGAVAAGRVPPIPAGHRAEYNLQHPDGSFQYGYDSGSAWATARGSAANEVQGNYAYGPVQIQYTAGVGGYVPSSVNLAAGGGAPTPSGGSSLRHESGIKSAWSPGDGIKSSWSSGSSAWRAIESAARGQHVPPLADGDDSQVTLGHSWRGQSSLMKSDDGSTDSEEPSGDASYQFGYQNQESSRQEVADAKGNIRGSYSFVTPNGSTRRVEYEAGAGKGFIAKGDLQPEEGDAPVAPPGAWQKTGGGIQTSWESQVGEQPTWHGDDVQTTLHDEQETSLQTGNGDLQANIQPGVQHGDGSYSFSYSTPDQSRQESGDANGNVQGSFSFVAKDDGKTRKVDYHAGADTGFVAKGDHLPKPQPSEVVKDNDSQKTLKLDDKIDIRTDDTQQTLLESDDEDSGDEGSGDEGSGDESSGDASYQFAYQTKDSSRQEVSDASGNVRGSFSFVAPDGVNRQVNYEAGAGKGFVAEGTHLPKEGSPQQADGTVPDEQQTQGPWEGALSTTLTDDDQQATQGPLIIGVATKSEEDGGGDSASDASYSYAYQTDSSKKEESADAAGNVKGSYSYNDGTGQVKTVTYTARGGEGFKASGDHLPRSGHYYGALASDVHGGANVRTRAGLGSRHGASRVLGRTLGASTQWSSPGGAQQAKQSVVEQQVGSEVLLRTYLPQNTIKSGYVFEAKSS